MELKVIKIIEVNTEEISRVLTASYILSSSMVKMSLSGSERLIK